jgi:exosortase A
MGIFTRNEFGAHAPARAFDPPRGEIRDGLPGYWRGPAFLTFACLAVALLAFWPTAVAMISTWYNSRTFSHGFLVFPLSACMVWRRRQRLALLHPATNWRGVPLLGAIGAAWLLANIAEIRVVEELVWIGILVALVWTLLGSEVTRTLAFPLAFLIFAVPLGVGLIGPLQDFTAWIAIHALTLSGIPAVLEHRLLSVPSSTWTVAEACSGIRYLFSSIMVGVIYAWSVYRSPKRRLVFMLFSVVVPIIANGFRAYGIVLLAYLSNNKLATNIDHIVYGWLFFAAVQLALFVIGARWWEPSRLPGPIPVLPTVPVPGTQSAGPLQSSLLAAGVVVIILGCIPAVALYLWNRAAVHSMTSSWPDPPVTVHLPWQAVPATDTSWTPTLRGTSREFVESYTTGSNRVDLFWALYPNRGAELLHSYNRVATPRSWSEISETQEEQTIQGRQVRIHHSLILSRQLARSVWTFYWVNGECTSSPARLKYLQAKARLRGASPTTILVALSTESSTDDSGSESVLREFLSHFSLLTPRSPDSAQNPFVESVQGKYESVHDLSR